MPHRRLPPLNALRAFEAAARHFSFKAAAKELSVTPAAVSQQIRGLEDDLQLTLFKRGPRSVALTEQGDALRAGLVDAFVQIHDAVEQARAVQAPGITLTCPAPVATKWLAPRLNRFSERHPEVMVHIEAGFEVADLGGGGPDIALRFGTPPDPRLYSEALCADSMIPVASPELVENLELRAPRDIVRAPLIHDDSLPNRFSTVPGWPEWFSATGLDPAGSKRGMRFKNYADQSIDAAIGGAGVLLARLGLAGDDLARERLVCPFGPVLPLELRYYLVCRKGDEQKECIAKFMDWMREENAASMAMHAAILRRVDAAVTGAHEGASATA